MVNISVDVDFGYAIFQAAQKPTEANLEILMLVLVCVCIVGAVYLRFFRKKEIQTVEGENIRISKADSYIRIGYSQFLNSADRTVS